MRAMTPETKFELLKLLLQSGAEVKTYYKPRRIMKVEKAADNYIVVTYENGGTDKIHVRDFSKRRFVVVI